jgi:hypothetical protein
MSAFAAAFPECGIVSRVIRVEVTARRQRGNPMRRRQFIELLFLAATMKDYGDSARN